MHSLKLVNQSQGACFTVRHRKTRLIPILASLNLVQGCEFKTPKVSKLAITSV